MRAKCDRVFRCRAASASRSLAIDGHCAGPARPGLPDQRYEQALNRVRIFRVSAGLFNSRVPFRVAISCAGVYRSLGFVATSEPQFGNASFEVSIELGSSTTGYTLSLCE